MAWVLAVVLVGPCVNRPPARRVRGTRRGYFRAEFCEGHGGCLPKGQRRAPHCVGQKKRWGALARLAGDTVLVDVFFRPYESDDITNAAQYKKAESGTRQKSLQNLR